LNWREDIEDIAEELTPHHRGIRQVMIEDLASIPYGFVRPGKRDAIYAPSEVNMKERQFSAPVSATSPEDHAALMTPVRATLRTAV
jgi:hypothetical protein